MVGVPAGRRTKYLVLLFWVVVVFAAGPLFGKLTGAEKNDAQSWLPPKAESTQVLALRSKFVSPNVFPAVVVYDRPGGVTSADRAKAAADAGRFAGVAGVVHGQVAGPFVARDGKAIETVVPVNLGHEGWNHAGTAADSLKNIAASGSQGLTIHIAGPVGYAADSGKAFKGIDSTLLFSALAVVIVLLLITYRSPILWLLPVISAGVALFSAQALIYLLALTLAELNSTKGLGPVLAIGVGVALLSMMTLLPALLVITGRWVFWPVKPAYGSPEPTARGVWARIGRRIAVRPRVVWITTAVLLGAMALGLTGLKASGLTNAQSFRGHPDSVAGQAVLDQHFPAGAGQPVGVFGTAASAGQLAAALRAVPGITAVTPPVTQAGHAYLEATLTSAPDSQAAYSTIDRIRA